MLKIKKTLISVGAIAIIATVGAVTAFAVGNTTEPTQYPAAKPASYSESEVPNQNDYCIYGDEDCQGDGSCNNSGCGGYGQNQGMRRQGRRGACCAN